MTKASIIVPTLNRAESLKTALGSFVRQDCPKERFEILVVDNGSTDNTRSVVESAMTQNPDCRIRYILEPVPGLLSGRHRGAREAQGEILMFVDDDIAAETSWLSAILQAFRDPSVHLVGGPSLPRFETDPPKWLEKFFQYRRGRLICGDLSLLDIGDASLKIDPTYIWGLNYAIRKQTLFNLGGFHPDCIPRHLQQYQGDGETGLSLKIRANKLGAVYAPGAKVYHNISRERLTVQYFENRYFYQGVCDSYTQIRARGGTREVTPPDYQAEAQGLPGASLYGSYREIIYRRIANAYVDGFRFHYNAVKENRRLLEWVCKENYFDYRLPDLGIDSGQSQKEPCDPAGKTEITSHAQSHPPELPNSDKGPSAYLKDEKTLSPKIIKQIEAFKNSPADERQSHMERSQNPLANLEYFSELKDRLKAAGVPVREEKINREDFDAWRRSVPRIVSFYRPGGDVFIEKCLEHYLVYKYLNLSARDIYLDVAAAESPWAEVLNRNHIRSYRLDMAYRKGIHGIDIGADAADTGLPDKFCTALSLQCAFECFMGDADVSFVKEASRLLASGGKYAIAPLYLEAEYFITTSPLIDQDEVVIDPGAKRVWRDDAYVEPFSRMYSPEVFKERIYSQIPPDTRAEVLYFENLEKILNYFQGQRIYCFFMLLAHKTGEAA